MFADIDLRELAELSGPERAFVSLYVSGPSGLNSLDSRIRKVRRLLAGEPIEAEHFEQNMRLVGEALDGREFKGGVSICVFACWANDMVRVLEIEKPVPDLLWVDSSPYIRPLAELQDEYENFVVVAADNTETRIYLVTSSVAEQEDRVKGDIKNQVKVGGWSQKRYARRRDRELHHYGTEIAAVLSELDARETFHRIILVGSKQTLEELKTALPEVLLERVAGERAVDLHEEGRMWDQAFDLFFDEERAEEEALWERIKGEYLRGGRAVAGPEDVLAAAATGRVDRMIVTRDAKIPGTRCRDCENLQAEALETCPVCGSTSVFTVDLVNELVELLALSSAEADFADPIPGLTEAGDVAALLRY
jgi:peptide subunit release factor 1 (eRF1)